LLHRYKKLIYSILVTSTHRRLGALSVRSFVCKGYKQQASKQGSQSYEIKSPPWTIWRFRILGIFSVENIDRLGDYMIQTFTFSCALIHSTLLSSSHSSNWFHNLRLIAFRKPIQKQIVHLCIEAFMPKFHERPSVLVCFLQSYVIKSPP
jgi:hypothetical protein